MKIGMGLSCACAHDVVHLGYYFLATNISYIPTLLPCASVDVSSCSDGKQPCGGASILAAGNQPVCDHLRCLVYSLYK
jgi:hypothetical protein